MEAAPEETPFLLSEEERRLLDFSRATLRRFLEAGEPLGWTGDLGSNLLQKRGVFVTLRRGEELRGCVGEIFGERPLWQGVSRSTILAASEDSRFPPVERVEEPLLRIEISVLGALRRIENPEEIRVGAHGLYLRRQRWSGLLLPQVAAERGWDSKTFLGHTAVKAGLPPAAWRGAELFVFSARKFRED